MRKPIFQAGKKATKFTCLQSSMFLHRISSFLCAPHPPTPVDVVQAARFSDIALSDVPESAANADVNRPRH